MSIPESAAGANERDVSIFAAIEAHAGVLAREAGERLASRARGSLHVEYKDSGTTNPVSEADREAEEFLYRAVVQRFPDHSVIGEEGRDPGVERTPFVWVIDPLDGTTNYLNGLSLWCVSIGVLWYGAPVAGAIYCPLGPDGVPALFLSRRGNGTTVNGQPARVCSSTEVPSGRLMTLPDVYAGEIARRKEVRNRGDVRTLGSIALELALTACGTLQFAAFWIPRLWDVAAGVSLVLEAGGSVLRRAERDQPWHEFRAFEAPAAAGLRNWRGSILAANATLIHELAQRVQDGRDPFAAVRRA